MLLYRTRLGLYGRNVPNAKPNGWGDTEPGSSPARRGRARVRIRATPHWQATAVAAIPSTPADPSDGQKRVPAARTRPTTPTHDQRDENRERDTPERFATPSITARVEPEARHADHGDDAADDGPTPNSVVPPGRLVRAKHRHCPSACLWRTCAFSGSCAASLRGRSARPTRHHRAPPRHVTERRPLRAASPSL